MLIQIIAVPFVEGLYSHIAQDAVTGRGIFGNAGLILWDDGMALVLKTKQALFDGVSI
jgi:hypothetical protein